MGKPSEQEVPRETAKASIEAAEVVLLDEISARLKKLTIAQEQNTTALKTVIKWLQSTEYTGVFESFTVDVAIADGVKQFAYPFPWFELTLINDGPQPVRISYEREKVAQSVDYNADDELTLKSKMKTTRPLYVSCPTGNASVRVVPKC